MKELFDTTPFAYVGNNKDYKEISKEELDALEDKSNKTELDDSVEQPKEQKQDEMLEPLPTSDEVEESSASVIGPMLPQVGLTPVEEPNVDNVIADINAEAELLKESLDNIVNGGEIYFESADFIEALKNKFKKDDVTSAKKINHYKIMKVAKAYTEMKLAVSRIKIATTKDHKVKGTVEYKNLQKKAISAEKEYRKLKKDLSDDELNTLKEYINGFDSNFNKRISNHIADIKEAKKISIKKEYAEFADDEEVINILTESVDNVDDMYFEGVNWDIHKRYREDLKNARKKIFTSVKHLKAHEYDNARLVLTNAIKEMDTCKNDALKEIAKIDDNKVITAICGYFLRNVTIVCRDILLLLLCAPAASVRSLIDGIKDISNIGKKYQEKGYFVPGDFNTYVKFVEKDYNRIIHILESFLNKIDDIEKKYEEKEAKKESIKKESVESECGTTEIVTEKDLDPMMKPLINKLHRKGYKTRSSSSGHKNVIIKKDTDRDNVHDGHHYGDARLVFDTKYNFGKAPKYWYWKKVDDEIDYLDVMQISGEESPNTDEKFNNWKDKYMRSLTNWVDDLPDISDNKTDKVEEACKTESMNDINEEIDTLFESVMSDLEINVLDI